MTQNINMWPLNHTYNVIIFLVDNFIQLRSHKIIHKLIDKGGGCKNIVYPKIANPHVILGIPSKKDVHEYNYVLTVQLE